jgi:hypothetical protein
LVGWQYCPLVLLTNNKQYQRTLLTNNQQY